MDKDYQIAVVLTCFNRKEMTLRCLRNLSQQACSNKLDFYICDDASTDGTYKAIQSEFPKANIIRSDGNLFWCRGMYEAMKIATENYHDLYLMVNDDVEFFPNCLETMIDTYEQFEMNDCGVVGITISKETGKVTYGGRIIIPYHIGKISFGIRSNYLIDYIPEKPLKCDLTNWNCFLVNQNVINKIGLIDNHYAHSVGDFDYSFRMGKKGIPIMVTNGAIGFCERNPQIGTYHDKNVPRKKRLKQLFSPKGMPIRTTYRFALKQNVFLGIVVTTWRYIQFLRCIIEKKDL